MREKNWYLDLGNKKQRRKGKVSQRKRMVFMGNLYIYNVSF